MAKPVIDWDDEKSVLLLNPLLPKHIKTSLENCHEAHSQLKRHIWLSSSGTESFPKLIALSKNSMLISAAAVNQHLAIQSCHPWLNILPLFHTGGLAIHARAYLSKSPLYDFSETKWNPHGYVELVHKYRIAFSSLTPTHVYDLVRCQLKPPRSLLAIIVGGSALPPTLHSEAYALGWPLLKSYGMTEICSQIATALDPHPEAALSPLTHLSLRFNSEEFIELKSDALLSGFVRGNDPERKWVDPKIGGWFTTQDKGVWKNGHLHLYGRAGNFLKIGGENVNFSDLEAVWEMSKAYSPKSIDSAIIDLPDERLGRVICLAIVDPMKQADASESIEVFNRQVLPLAKIRQVCYVDSLPRSELHKLQKETLRNLFMLEIKPSSVK